MSRADSGGFDVVFELALASIRQRLAPVIGVPLPDATIAMPNWGNLVFHSELALSDLTLLPDATIRTTVGGSIRLSWPALVASGITLIGAGSQVFAASISVSGTPEASGTSLAARFTADAVQIEIAPGTLEGIPGVAAYLTFIGAVFGNAARETERTRLYDNAEAGIEDSLNASLPDVVPLGTVPRPPVSSVEIVAVGQELRVLMMVGGRRAGANPAAITRSAIRIGPAGVPRDLAAVIIGNACVLRDLLRPMLRTGLGLTNSGFLSTHPCAWSGNVALPASATVAGVRPAVRAVIGGIDTSGALRVRLAFDGEHSTGAFGITGSIDLRIGLSITTAADGSRTLTLTVGTGVVTSLDIWVAWWVYVGGIFVSPLLTLAIALTDAFAGGALANTINSAVRSAIGPGTLSLPLPSGAIGVTGLSAAQPDAEPRTITVGPFSISDFPANDVIVTIG